MTTQRVIPISALHDQIAQREARLLAIEEEVAKLTRERAAVEQEIKLHRAMEALAVDGETARQAAPTNGSIDADRKRSDVSPRILQYVRRHPGCAASEVADRFEGHAKGYGVKTARKVVTDAIFDLCRRGKMERSSAGLLTVIAAQGGET